MAKILLVEDDAELSASICGWLQAEDYTVELVADGNEGLSRAKLYSYDLLILDWNLPGRTGVEICKEYRCKGGQAPVLMLTGRQELQDKECGLDSGADDYLTKPFHPRELSARIRALLRRSPKFDGDVLTAANLILDLTTKSLTVDGKVVKLLPLELALLELFMRNPCHVLSADAILDRVWSSESEATPEVVRTYIKTLRRKISTSKYPELIQTLWGQGYRFDPQPSSQD